MKAWDAFWFKPTSPLPLCFFRVFFGALVLIHAISLWPDALTWYGPHGVLSAVMARRLTHAWPLSPLLWGSGSEALVVTLVILEVVAGTTLMLGYRTRLSSILVWFCLLSFHQRNPFIHQNADSLLRIYAFLLMFGPAGARLSLDARASNDDSLHAPWVQRLLQVQMAMAYWHSFWGKLAGQTWRNGTAVYYISHLTDERSGSLPAFLDHLWIYQAFSYLSLVTELALWSLVWTKKLRYPCLLLGLGFHFFIQLLFNLDLQNFAIVAVYATFLVPADLERWISSAVAQKWRR